MKVGTICKLKVACLGNAPGTLGVVFNDYGDGFQAIFKNGNYDGFSTAPEPAAFNPDGQAEMEYFLEEVGFEKLLADYQFTNVIQVCEDYRKGLFDIAWSEKQKESGDYEKCEVYADGNKPSLLRFKRKIHTGEKQTPIIQSHHLSCAMDFADFAWFEYAYINKKSILPRWMLDNKTTLYPQFVVFHK